MSYCFPCFSLWMLNWNAAGWLHGFTSTTQLFCRLTRPFTPNTMPFYPTTMPFTPSAVSLYPTTMPPTPALCHPIPPPCHSPQHMLSTLRTMSFPSRTLSEDSQLPVSLSRDCVQTFPFLNMWVERFFFFIKFTSKFLSLPILDIFSQIKS